MALYAGALEDALGRRVPMCGGSSGHLEQKQIGAHWHPSPSISSEELSDLKPHKSQQSRPYVRAIQPRQRRQQGQAKIGAKTKYFHLSDTRDLDGILCDSCSGLGL